MFELLDAEDAAELFERSWHQVAMPSWLNRATADLVRDDRK
jgi:hypothetical protein